MSFIVLLILSQTAGVYSSTPPSNAPGMAVRPLGTQTILIADAGVLNVQGPLTDAQLRAGAVPVYVYDAGVLNVNPHAVTVTGGVVNVQIQDAGAPLNVNPVVIAGGVLSVQIQDAGAPLNVQGPLTDAQLRATPVPVSTPDGGTLWAFSLWDGGTPASDDAVQRSAGDLMAIRRLLEQILEVQLQEAEYISKLKEPGR